MKKWWWIADKVVWEEDFETTVEGILGGEQGKKLPESQAPGLGMPNAANFRKDKARTRANERYAEDRKAGRVTFPNGATVPITGGKGVFGAESAMRVQQVPGGYAMWDNDGEVKFMTDAEAARLTAEQKARDKDTALRDARNPLDIDQARGGD